MKINDRLFGENISRKKKKKRELISYGHGEGMQC